MLLRLITIRQHCPLLALQQTGPKHIDWAAKVPPAAAPDMILHEIIRISKTNIKHGDSPIPSSPNTAGDITAAPVVAAVNKSAAPPATIGKLTEKSNY